MNVMNAGVVQNDLAAKQDSPAQGNALGIKPVTQRVIFEIVRDESEGKRRPGEQALQHIIVEQFRRWSHDLANGLWRWTSLHRTHPIREADGREVPACTSAPRMHRREADKAGKPFQISNTMSEAAKRSSSSAPRFRRNKLATFRPVDGLGSVI